VFECHGLIIQLLVNFGREVVDVFALILDLVGLLVQVVSAAAGVSSPFDSFAASQLLTHNARSLLEPRRPWPGGPLLPRKAPAGV
jgi:hypothetical protein